MNITTHKTQDFKPNSKGELVCVTSYDVEVEGATVGWVNKVEWCPRCRIRNGWTATYIDGFYGPSKGGCHRTRREAVEEVGIYAR